MSHVLFICTGNICRSPFAERFSQFTYESQGRSGWSFSSAGTGAIVGSGMEPNMRARLKALGGTSQGFAARQVNAEMLMTPTLILTLESAHRDWVLEEMPMAIKRTFTLGQAARFAREDGAHLQGQEFIEELKMTRGRPLDEDNIEDPYKQGEEAADRASTRIVSALGDLLPKLVD